MSKTKASLTTVCRGWFDIDNRRVHNDIRILHEGNGQRPWSDGICPLCRDAFMARVDLAVRKHKAGEEASR